MGRSGHLQEHIHISVSIKIGLLGNSHILCYRVMIDFYRDTLRYLLSDELFHFDFTVLFQIAFRP